MDRWLRRLPVLLVVLAAALIGWLALDIATGFRADRSESGFGAAEEVVTTAPASTVARTTTTERVATTTVPAITTTTPPAPTTTELVTTTTEPWPVSCREALLTLVRGGGTLANGMRWLTSLITVAQADEGGWNAVVTYADRDMRYWLDAFEDDIDRSLASTTKIDDPTQWFSALDWQAYAMSVDAVLGDLGTVIVDGAPDPDLWVTWRASWERLLEDYATVSARASDATHCRS